MRLKLDAKDFACRSKAKAKPQRRELEGSSPRTVPIGKRIWTDVEPGKYSFSDYEVSRKVTYLLRHSQHVHREEDGAVHFWRIKEHLQKYFLYGPHWSDGWWKACMAGGGGNKKRFQYCTDSPGTIVYLRAKPFWLKPFCPTKPTEFCFCLCTVIELIVVCRRVVSERSLWK